MFRFCFRLTPSLFVLSTSFFKKAPPAEEPTKSAATYQHLTCTGFECLRQSSMLALSSSSSFLKQTLYYHSELTQRYCVHLNTMISLLEEYQRYKSSNDHQQKIWNVFVEQRQLSDEMKNELLRLRLLLSTLDRLVNESIDAGYQTQNETTTQLVTNELITAKHQILQNEELIAKNELLFTQTQVKTIEDKPSSIDSNEKN